MATGLSSAYRRAALGPRTLTAVVGIPVLLLALWAGGAWWIGVTAAVALLGAHELTRLAAMPVPLRVGVLLLVAAGLVGLLAADDAFLRVLVFLWGLFVLEAAARYFSERPASQLYWALRGATLSPFYLAMPMALLARWRLEFTPWSVLAFLLVIWTSDIAAYFVGIAAGRHKLAPRISPGKSWEGAVAGVVAGGSVGMLAASLLELRPVLGLAFGVLVTIASQVGDLLESVMKRRAGVKDSGAILPGHGGILDRFDGVLVAAPIAYIAVRYWAGSP